MPRQSASAFRKVRRAVVETLEGRRLLALITPDPTFGVGGAVVLAGTGPGDPSLGEPLATLPLAGGKILAVAGALMRINADGTVDASFGNQGRLDPNLPGSARTARVQPDQKILITSVTPGGHTDAVHVTRLNADGSPDAGFGTDGTVTIPGMVRYAGDTHGTAIQTDGKILIAGRQLEANPPPQAEPEQRLAVVRLNADGTVDTTFGASGTATALPLYWGGGQMTVDPDGRILVFAHPVDGFPALLRFTPAGQFDTSFSADGMVEMDDLPYPHRYAMKFPTVGPGGKIYVTGEGPLSLGGSVNGMIITRLNGDGSLDTAFADGGAIKEPRVGPGALFVAADGKITVPTLSLEDDVAAVRYNADGSLDTTFNDTGYVSIKPLFAQYESAWDRSAVLDSDTLLIQTNGSGWPGRLIKLAPRPADGLDDGTLIATGTDGDDTISVAASGSNLVLTVNGSSQTFAAASVLRVDIEAGGGNDTVTVAPSLPATVRGGTGNDAITTADGHSNVHAEAGNDTVTTGDGMDTVYGGDGHDRIDIGDGLLNYVDAGDGDNAVTLNNGTDTLICGAGDDVVVSSVTVRTDGSTDGINTGDGDDHVTFTTTLSQGPGFSVDTGGGNDTVIGSSDTDDVRGGGGDDSLVGNGGADTIDGQGGNDTIRGGDGNDSLAVAGAGANSVDGGAGDDDIRGSAGADAIAAGDGNDTVFGDFGADSISAGAGDDVVTIHLQINQVPPLDPDGEYQIIATPGTGPATVSGGDGADAIISYGGSVSLFGDAGADLIRAATTASESAVVHGGSGNDRLFAGSGNDSLFGGAQKDRLYGGAGNDFLLGGGGYDRLFGQGGDDTLQGGRANDYLDGGDGSDSLIGGPGPNTLAGGAGNDTFVTDNGVIDLIDGGPGDDGATDRDDEDELSDVEAV